MVRLAVRYGPDMDLDRVLSDLAHDCPYWCSTPRKYDPRCGARFEDLDKLRPHDLPGEPMHRQRQPAREDIPQRRARDVPEPDGRYPMLSEWKAPRIVVTCAKCGRRDVHRTEDVRTMVGPDAAFIVVRIALTADCPRRLVKNFSDWCAGLLVSEG